MLSYIKNFKPVKKAGPPVAAEATAKPETPEPVLNADDESFLQSQLDASDEPAVIFPDSEATSGTVTPAVVPQAQLDVSDEPAFIFPAVVVQAHLDASDEPAFIFPGSEATSGTVTPAVAEAAAEAEKETAKEKDWKDVLATRWDGLKRTVSSAADRRKSKAAEDAAKKEEKKKLSEKEKEKKAAARPEEREDELTAALEQLNLAAEDVTRSFQNPKTLLTFCSKRAAHSPCRLRLKSCYSASRRY
jgi:flagellar biosynthesis GTPase FlhF